MTVKGSAQTPKKKNGFIVIEGVNGAGKTSVRNHLLSRLRDRGILFVDTFEPGDTPLGKSLRELLLGKLRDIRSTLAELLLFAADRAEHVERVIKPALADGKIVVCDRYYYSMIAFQGYGRGLDCELIENLNNLAVASTYPDFTLLLDVDPAVGLLRNKNSDKSSDAMEEEALAFHTRIRQGFLEVAKNSKEDFIVIDASQSLTAVLAEVDRIVDIYLQD